ncbi:MAG: hypothetical protein CM15mP66_02380 [Pseudomonadota bacterium]|nr:MAG: hypothetical protein CM15mP66_02380 [Pseudomonadota bacterium]
MLEEGMRAVKLSEQVNVHYILNHLLDMPALKEAQFEFEIRHLPYWDGVQGAPKIQSLEDLPLGIVGS